MLHSLDSPEFRQKLKYLSDYIGFVVSKEIEALCCGKDGTPLALPETVERQLSEIGSLRRLVKDLPKESIVRNMAKRYQALSDPVRLRVLWALSMADLCPCILKQVSKLSDSKLSYHLRILERSGLISSRRTKNWMIYSITALGAKVLKRWNDID